MAVGVLARPFVDDVDPSRLHHGDVLAALQFADPQAHFQPLPDRLEQGRVDGVEFRAQTLECVLRRGVSMLSGIVAVPLFYGEVHNRPTHSIGSSSLIPTIVCRWWFVSMSLPDGRECRGRSAENEPGGLSPPGVSISG